LEFSQKKHNAYKKSVYYTIPKVKFLKTLLTL